LLIIKQGLADDKIADVLSEAERQNIPVQRLPKNEIDAMALGKTHGGILALCTPKLPTAFDEIVALLKIAPVPPLLLLLEGVEDSQNLGYTLRSAEALGVQAVLLKKHLWEFDEVAVSRASSGAYERLPVVKIERAGEELEKLRRHGLRIWGCIANAKRACYEVDLTGPILLAIGGEKRGLSAAVRERCDGFMRIPMREKATSLSLSHAASILLAEAMRQRLVQSKPTDS
jgi:23S rRNA (guanosine2251-2'-O)-methyltransferase